MRSALCDYERRCSPLSKGLQDLDLSPVFLHLFPVKLKLDFIPTGIGNNDCAVSGVSGGLQEGGGIQAEVLGQNADVRLAYFTLTAQDSMAQAAVTEQTPQIRFGHTVLSDQASQ